MTPMNIYWQKSLVNKAGRSEVLKQRPRCIWMTGLSGAGKSTLAHQLEAELHAKGLLVYVLDGDNLRHGLNKDLGFSVEDRRENIRRVAEVARLMVDAGLIVIVSVISPFRNERLMARQVISPDDFVEVFVDAPLSVCEVRDPKGLYARARRGELKEFTGVDSPYEVPDSPEVHLHTDCDTINLCTQHIHRFLDTR